MSEDWKASAASGRKEIQIFRNEIQGRMEQIPNPAERNPN